MQQSKKVNKSTGAKAQGLGMEETPYYGAPCPLKYTERELHEAVKNNRKPDNALDKLVAIERDIQETHLEIADARRQLEHYEDTLLHQANIRQTLCEELRQAARVFKH
jgi:hypothetical protein